MLDLKKLILVPLVCYVLVQQTDAAIQEVKNAEFSVSHEEKPEIIVKKFEGLVECEETKGAASTISNRQGVTEPINANLRVASDVDVTRSGLQWWECQLGGMIASVRDSKKDGVCVYKGVKKQGGTPADNSVKSLYATNKASHTERQLVGRVLKDRGTLSGRHFIYTALPPCANGGRDENGNLDCCTWYIKVLEENPGAEFYIFFRAPRVETLKGYAKFDTYGKLRCLWDFVMEVLGEDVYKIAEAREDEEKKLGKRHRTVLENLKTGVDGAQATTKDCEVIENFLFGCLMLVMENMINIGKYYNNVARVDGPEYAESVARLYQRMIEQYAGNGAITSKIHFYSLNARTV